ncbi:MAG: DNA polymerase domain-containing protein [Candidatus Hodarchaeota archaeon]
MSHTQAWLHEIETTDWGVYSHWITGSKIIRAFYPLTAEFFLAKSDQRIRKQLLSHPHIESVEEVERYLSIHDWKLSPVLCIRVNPRHIRSTYEDLRKYWGEYLHNADLSLWQQFCFQTQLFPYAYATIEVQNDILQDWQLLEAYTDADYQSVPFRTLWFQPVFEEQHLSRGKVTEVLFRKSVRNPDEEPLIIDEKNEEDTIETSIKYIQKIDPDILFTSGGDTFIPQVAERAVYKNLGHLRLGRGIRPLSTYVRRENSGHGHSYMSYGRVYHSQFGVYLDGGRHHYDVGNSFMWKDGNIDGIHELVRLGCSDPQRVARGTIGTTLSAVQMKTAYDRKILIPSRKADAENFRPAWSMQSDVGGLVFSPRVGFHTNVTELDFLSMYPNIMVHKNVSPETINCKCCPGEQVVPLTDHHICTRRPGMISLSLENILNRRQHFKAKRNLDSKYDRRQKVLKWLLVTCFGYTGYRNARFGRIESHEAISAYGRYTLTLAQKIAAQYDLEVIAGIVDSIWLKREDNEPIPIEISQELRQEVADLTGLPVEHAADYHWIVFLPRRHEPEIGVLNRYYGLRTDGKFKIRGIEIRQSSSPPFIKKLQTHMLTILAQARSGGQFQAAAKRAYRLMKSYKEELAEGRIPLKELLITIRPSRVPNEYINNSRQAIAARQLAKAGVTVEPGIKLNYLITNAAAQDPDERVKVEQLITGGESYDLTEYQKLCTRAYESLIPPEFETKDLTLELFLDH